jgi:hypothetical protein
LAGDVGHLAADGQALIKKLFWESTLADHGAEGANGNVFSWMWDDDGMGIIIAIFGMTSPL